MNKEERYDADDTYFKDIGISIASSDVIREKWSRGEIKKPETINYRTFKPEKGGLFCEKIFGPMKDWECGCGKYKKIKHKGIVCDRCGVEVTLSKVRRERMAHIDLAVSVVHIWFFKTQPSRIGNFLGMTAGDLERVIYYEEYVVVDPGRTTLEKKQLLNDAEYREAKEKWGKEAFSAMMGGDAIKALLIAEDLNGTVLELKDKLRKTKSLQARMKIAKRLKIVEGFAASVNSQDSMVMNALPVIPPDLRPLVPLDGGRFATSDLNDLYRRVINRNNRLKSILRLKTPDVIIRNEKRMLQEAVDALFDNGRHGHPVMGAGNRPLKSLSEMLKGKQGRFRQNLLGKRVDYSGRSVIVVGPDLKFNQCGLPKKMALDLFEPFIVKKLKDYGYVYTIRSAKKMIARQDERVWDVLEEIIQGHPVLLNRAPTLHRLGLQAFEPVLIEGKAIRVHPLVCSAFNADFDGDQMAVHIPLSVEAQIEARTLMMAPDNIFLPSSGKPVAIPSKDMILGLYYIMHDAVYDNEDNGGKNPVFGSPEEVILALNSAGSYNWEEVADGARKDDLGRGIRIHQKIRVRIGNDIIETTPGRVLFNRDVPVELGFQNYSLPSKKLAGLILDIYKTVGLEKTVKFLDAVKNLGFEHATKSSLSMGITDIKIPENKKQVIDAANKEAALVIKQYEDGIITETEKNSKIETVWNRVSSVLTDELFDTIKNPPVKSDLNPIFMMIDSGARGNKAQLKQLGALRGLMSKPNGETIINPITSNFREGLTVLEYFISSHGARKGLSDTALKTADSGYLTRRLVDVAQDVLVNEEDCGTIGGIEVSSIKQGGEDLLPIKERIFGRSVCDDVFMPGDKTTVLAKAGDILTLSQAEAIEDAGIESLKIRSTLTCESGRGVCAKCYGINLANGRTVAKGEAVGIIAAQSIGEPGTQLTMRTFHLGGISAGGDNPEIETSIEGLLIYEGVRIVKNKDGINLALNKNGKIHIVRDEGRKIEEYKNLVEKKSIEPLFTLNVEQGTQILFEDGAAVEKGDKIAILEQLNYPVISEKGGYVKFDDLVEGLSTQKSINKQTGQAEIVVKQHRGELHPQIMIYSDEDCLDLIGTYAIPSGAHLSCEEGNKIEAGDQLARLPKGAARTKDITGGLPRVAELVEARKPKNAAEIAKIDGTIDMKGVQKNKRIVIVRDESTGMEEEHLIPLTKHLIVQQGDLVEKGQQITDGVVQPHEILEICGIRELQKYFVNQVQEVYRLQGVDVDDKHIEIIVRQMLQKVRITDPGDTTFLYGEDIDKKMFHMQNKKVLADGGRPAQAAPVLLGITKASLGTESYFSAASFQETTRILTDAACEGKVDYLLDFKSNIITGQKMPSGTGHKAYVKRLEMDKQGRGTDEFIDFDFESTEMPSKVPAGV
ncbi:MAG: DNA-directed RNA polymerase subunit beta' [Chlamydiia bacterium]|nr:DNA-directed RNA polymerase subunit beta' [Chlamydiia bacterium]MCH9618619.1 DNA-directed RNA polymerase subunit beta' [Chlamydiia bacterium]MCH9624339.1 DNA-directed RNA polymerase subunit beta' [Chlamydiia bacterium]